MSTEGTNLTTGDDFYVRYYVGHEGTFGHEFLEFELRPDGLLRYANNSEYKKDSLIRKEVSVSDAVMGEIKRIVDTSHIIQEDDKTWPEPNEDGRQELEIVLNGQHISFVTATIGSMAELEKHPDAASLKLFYFLIQDLKCFVFSLIGLHFKIKPT